MKKTLLAYGGMLSFIYLSYLLFAVIFASLFHYAHLQPSFYNLATKICSYLVLVVAGLGFGLLTEEKRLFKGFLFCLIYTIISTLLLWHHFNLFNLLIKNLIIMVSILIVNFIKK